MLSIIIPCYNEEKNLPILVEKLTTLIKSTNHSLDIILVNNGSTDNSAAVLEQLLQNQTIIRSILVPVNQGYGYGLSQGFNSAKGDILACTHADMQTDPQAIIEAYDKYLQLAPHTNQEILIKGRRINRPIIEQIFTFLMQTYANLKLKTNLSDISAQPKLFSKTFWNNIHHNAPHDFALDLYLVHSMKKIGAIHTIDVDYSLRQFGESTGGSGSWISRIKASKRMILTINKLAKNIQ